MAIVAMSPKKQSIGHFLEILHPAPLLPMNGHFWIQKLPGKKVRDMSTDNRNIYLFKSTSIVFIMPRQ